MLKRIRSHLYTDSKMVHMKLVRNENGYLYSGGIYPTKITIEDLPKWFIEGTMYHRTAYLDAKNVKDLYFIPNYVFDNKFLKYDCLYISYDKPLEIKESNKSECCDNYDEVINGLFILKFIDGVQHFTDFDIGPVVQAIEERIAHFKEQDENIRQIYEDLFATDKK